MKKVVSPEMTAHLWANKSQPEAQNSGRTIFFVGSTIYSYGSHYPMASFLKDSDYILWNDCPTTQTTASKHKPKAWSALSSQQRGNLLLLPSLSDSDAASLYRQRQYPSKTLPETVKRCVQEVIRLVASMSNMRSANAMSRVLGEAVTYERSGKALLAYVNPDKYKGAKWSLPDLPAVMPLDKAERAAVISSFAKSELLETYRTKRSEYEAGLERLEGSVSAFNDVPDSYITPASFPSTLSDLGKKLGAARAAYKTATGKEFSGALQMQKVLASYAATLAPITAKFMAEQRILELRNAVSIVLLRNRSRKIKGLQKLGLQYRPHHHLIRSVEAAQREIPDLGEFKSVVEKILRQVAWQENAEGLEGFRAVMADAEEDTAGTLVLNSLQVSGYQDLSLTGRFYEKNKAEIDRLSERRLQILPELQARLAERAKAEIVAWLAGSNVRTNHFPALMARIKDGNVQTTRGAEVPLEHACRLARIARRVIAAGGKSWPAGEGPIVGGFRVNSIGADGATVIGCHEFSAAESLRILALLEACPVCAEVTAEV